MSLISATLLLSPASILGQEAIPLPSTVAPARIAPQAGDERQTAQRLDRLEDQLRALSQHYDTLLRENQDLKQQLQASFANSDRRASVASARRSQGAGALGWSPTAPSEMFREAYGGASQIRPFAFGGTRDVFGNPPVARPVRGNRRP